MRTSNHWGTEDTGWFRHRDLLFIFKTVECKMYHRLLLRDSHLSLQIQDMLRRRLQLRLTHDIQLLTRTRTHIVRQHMNTHRWQTEVTCTLNITASCARWRHMIVILVENSVSFYLVVTWAELSEKQLIVRAELTAVILSCFFFFFVTSQFSDELWLSGWTLCHLSRIRPGNSAAFPTRLPQLNNGNLGEHWLVGWLTSCSEKFEWQGHICDVKRYQRQTCTWPPLGPLGPTDRHFKGQCPPEYCCRLFSPNCATLCHFPMALSNWVTSHVSMLSEHWGATTS